MEKAVIMYIGIKNKSAQQNRLYPPSTEFHFFEIVYSLLCNRYCDEGFGRRNSFDAINHGSAKVVLRQVKINFINLL